MTPKLYEKILNQLSHNDVRQRIKGLEVIESAIEKMEDKPVASRDETFELLGDIKCLLSIYLIPTMKGEL